MSLACASAARCARCAVLSFIFLSGHRCVRARGACEKCDHLMYDLLQEFIIISCVYICRELYVSL